eukprot:TRINITY_DN12479_c1_g1_i16.p3 TRINITY_DN12479_c1_g1~~TRINITY_DN12479_c1_g1_i16.p3  ORF type:complete len:251 (+),score=35.82 TRINITY_DN12479_c1_g1_i16:4246-4998(+)
MVAFCRRVADGNIHLSQRVSDDNTSQSFLIGMALQLKIRTLNESNFDVELGVEQVQVDDLKAAIAAVQSQWPVDRQRLLYRGQVLESGHALAEYDVKDGVAIHLIDKPPGRSDEPAAARHSAQASQHQHGQPHVQVQVLDMGHIDIGPGMNQIGNAVRQVSFAACMNLQCQNVNMNVNMKCHHGTIHLVMTNRAWQLSAQPCSRTSRLSLEVAPPTPLPVARSATQHQLQRVPQQAKAQQTGMLASTQHM